MGRRGGVTVVSRSASCAIAVLFCMAACGGSDTDGGVRRPGFGNPSGTSGAGGFGAGGALGGAGFGNPNGQPNGQAGTGVQNPPLGGSGGEQCAEAMVNTSTSTPTILFVVDGSGSMCEQFGGSTRWQALRSALLDQAQGLVYRMQSQVVFGAMLYDGTIDLLLAATSLGGSPTPACSGMYTEMKATGECPGLIQVAPALDNAAAIDMAFPATELGGSTPTDRAMKSAVDLMLGMRSTNPDVVNNPLYIILATDGQPNDICTGGVSAGGDGSAQKAGVITEVDRAAAADITTFVISLAGNDANLQAHLEEVADHGDPTNPDAHTFSPTSPEDLANTLAVLVGGAIGCEVVLNGMVTVGQECRGFVELNGGNLPCCQNTGGAWTCGGAPAPGEPNGWRLKDERTVELIGSQCLDFLQAPEASLRASFPCDVFSPD